MYTWLAPRLGISNTLYIYISQGTIWGQCYFSFTPMIYPLILKVVDICWWHPGTCSQFWLQTQLCKDLSRFGCCCRMGWQLGMLFSAEKSKHPYIGKVRGQRVTMRCVPLPEVKHHSHLGLVLNKLSRTEHIKMCTELVVVWLVFCVGDFKGIQSRQFSLVLFSHVWNMRPKFGVENHCKAYKILQTADAHTWWAYKNYKFSA